MKNTIEQIEKNKVIVIVRGVEKEKLIPMCQAIYDGGLRIIECTYDASGKIRDEEIAGNIKMLADHFEGKMLVGAGTVLTEKQVELTKKAGGKFIISPDTNSNIIKDKRGRACLNSRRTYSHGGNYGKQNRCRFRKNIPYGYDGSKIHKRLESTSFPC